MIPGSERVAGLLILTLALASSGCSVYDYVAETFDDSDSASGSRGGGPSSYVALGVRYHVMDSAEGYVERGLASWLRATLSAAWPPGTGRSSTGGKRPAARSSTCTR